MILTLEVKWMVEEWLVLCRNVFREMKKKKVRQITMYFCKVTLVEPLSSVSLSIYSASATPEITRPVPPLSPPLQPAQCEDRDEDLDNDPLPLMMIYCHLMNSE